jgi:SAM-dependent methyltransferase
MESSEEWDKRFKEKGYVWGQGESPTALEALHYLKTKSKILDVGCGYGRDYKLFLEKGFEVVGLDSSGEAIKLAKEFVPKGEFIKADAIKMPFGDGSFDVVFSHLFMHLLYEDDVRKEFLKECGRLLRPGGLIIESFFSTDDPTFGEGQEVAPRTFYVERKARIGRFFNEEEVRSDFSDFEIIELKKLSEEHSHGSPHTHVYWFVVAKKP